MFSIYYNRTDVVVHLLSDEYEDMFNPFVVIAPPQSNNDDHIMNDDQENE